MRNHPLPLIPFIAAAMLMAGLIYSAIQTTRAIIILGETVTATESAPSDANISLRLSLAELRVETQRLNENLKRFDENLRKLNETISREKM